MNPKSEKVILVIANNKSINKGCLILKSTNIVDVNRINMLISIDLLAAAPAYPITISYAEIGADNNSKIEPLYFGKYIPNAAKCYAWILEQ